MKTAISIIIIIFSLVAFAFVGVLLSIDYKKAQNELVDLLGADATSQMKTDRIEFGKFPKPRLIAYDIKIPGILNAHQMIVNFSLTSILQHKPRITDIEVHQPGFDLNILVKYEGNKLSYGKATIKTNHIAQFLKDYPDLRTAVTNFIPAQATNLTFDIVLSDEYLTFTNLEISSKILECSGEIALPRSKDVRSKVQLTCDKVIFQDEELSKVSILGKSDNDGLHLESITGSMASGGNFIISGNLTKNIYRSVFEGNFKFNHDDINIALAKLGMKSLAAGGLAKTMIESDFRVTPAEFLLSKFRGQMGSIGIAGNSDIKIIGSMPRVFLNFNIRGFNSSEEYPLVSPLLQYFASLLKGTEEREYIAKFVPIRKIDYLGNYQISLISPIIEGIAADSLDISAAASAGKLDIKSFNYVAGNNNLNGSLALDTISIKPKFSLNIASSMWSTGALTIKNLLAINSSLQNADFSKVNLLADITFQSLSQNDIALKNVKLNIQNDGNNIGFSLIKASFGDSNIQMNGTVSTASAMNINMAYVYDSLNLNNISKLFGFNIELGGIANCAGVLSTSGTTSEELLYNLYTKSKFMASRVDVQGFAIDDLIVKLSNLKYNRNDLNDDIKSFTSLGITPLKDISGNVNIETGIIYLKDVVLSSAYTSGAIEMAYNIYNQDLNFASLWSFQLPLASNNITSTFLKISKQKKGDDSMSNIDTTDLLKAFNARDVQKNLLNPAAAEMIIPHH